MIYQIVMLLFATVSINGCGIYTYLNEIIRYVIAIVLIGS